MRKIILFFALLTWAGNSPAQKARDWDRPDTCIPYRMVGGKLIVDVEFDGIVRPFLFDTGFSISAIMDSLYVEAGLDSLCSMHVRDANGVRVSQIVTKTGSFRLGGWSFSGKEFLVVDSGTFPYHCFGVQGVVGSDLLQGKVVRFSPRDSCIFLTDHTDGNSLKKRDGIKLKIVANCPYFPLYLSSGKKTAGHWAMFDTGAEDYSLHVNNLDYLQKKKVMGIPESAPGFNTIGAHGLEESNTQYRGILPAITIGSHILEQVPFGTTRGSGSLVGTFLLNYGVVTIDYAKKRFYFEPFDVQTVVAPPVFRKIVPVFEGNEFVVGVVWDEELRRLVQPGDRILTMNGLPAGDYEFCRLLDGTLPKGWLESLSVETRSGDIMDITL